MASCKYYDAGWCYAPKDIKSNDVKGACIEPEYCPYLKSKMTEKEKIEGEIKILQKKLSFLEELSRTKSPCEEAFKRVYSVYPSSSEKSAFWTDDDEDTWIVFQNGYTAAQEDYKVGEYQETTQERGKRVHKEMEEQVKKLQEKEWNVDVKTNLKPQTPEQVSDGLKEAFREAIKQGIIPEVDKVSDEFMDEMVAKLKGQTLRDVCMEWWSDVYDWDDETSIQDLISRIEEWLPKPQNADGSQNAYVESAVEGFNDCLNTIKRKLR